jgi:flagellar basal-body rod protein FlgG
MYRILQTGRTGLEALQKKMDTISNNIANVQTHGYKGMEVQFEDLVYDEVANKGVPLSQEAREKPIEIGTGSRVKSTERRFIQGILEETTYPYHLAIEGEGFFGVQDANGETYLTRDGGFTLDSQGQLVDSRGNHVIMDTYSPLSQWSKNGIVINEAGVVSGLDDIGQPVEIGSIRLFNVPDKSILISKGDNYFSTENLEVIYTNENINEDWGSIHQGYLEKSSVNIGKELVDMLVTQRAYQINTKSIHSADEMWSMVNQLKR